MPWALHHISSAYLASSIAFAADLWPTVDGCFAPCWPHDLQAPAQPAESPSGLGIIASLPVDLQGHLAPCWHGTYLRLQR